MGYFASGSSEPNIAFLVSLPDLQRAAFDSIRTGNGARVLEATRLWQLFGEQVAEQAKKLELVTQVPGRKQRVKAFLHQWPTVVATADGALPAQTGTGAQEDNAAPTKISRWFGTIMGWLPGRERQQPLNLTLSGPLTITNTIKQAVTALEELSGSGAATVFVDDYSECHEVIQRWMKVQNDGMYSISLNAQKPIRLRLAGYPSHRGSDHTDTKLYSDFFTRQIFEAPGYLVKTEELLAVEFFRDIIQSEAEIAGVAGVFPPANELVTWARLSGMIGGNPRRFGELLYKTRENGWEGVKPLPFDMFSHVCVAQAQNEIRTREELLTTVRRREKTGLPDEQVKLDVATRKWANILALLRETRSQRPRLGQYDLLFLPDHSDWSDTEDEDVNRDGYLRPLRELESLINAGYLFPIRVLPDPDGRTRRVLVLGVPDQVRVASGMVALSDLENNSWLLKAIEELDPELFDEVWQEPMLLRALEAVV